MSAVPIARLRIRHDLPNLWTKKNAMLGLMGCNPEQTWSRAAGVMPGLIAPPSPDKWLRRSSL